MNTPRHRDHDSTAVGQPVRRVEDARFLTGQGRYADDITLPNMAYAHVVRSPHAHARIHGIETGAALAAPGVLAIFTGEDVARDGLGTLPCRFWPSTVPGTPSHRPSQPILAVDKVRHVGDRVAFVVAETARQAQDAAELVATDYELLVPVASLADALAPGAPTVWDEAGGNLCFQLERGDRAVVDRAFAAAAHTTRLSFRYPRSSANPMEPRVAICRYDRFDDRYTLYSACQSPHRLKEIIATVVLGIPETNLRVVAPDVGGSFGMKGNVYPEEALIVWVAGKLDRPVKWTGDRSECLMSDMCGRDQVAEAELALAADGRMLALRASITVNVGAYLGYAAGVTAENAATTLTSVYDLPLVHAVVRTAFTNTNTIGPFRGAGRPESTYIVERLIETACREMGIDPITIRRRNLIPSSAMPYTTPGGHEYDSGDFALMLDRTLPIAGWSDFPARRADSELRGRLRGIGLGMHCEYSGLQSERMEIRVEPNGSVAVHVGTLSTGQSHETMFAQMISEWLGVPFSRIRVFQGDTDRVLFGRGTFAERSMIAGGSALRAAADVIIDKGKKLAALMLEASQSDIEFDDGVFRVSGTDRAAHFDDVARMAYAAHGIPAEFGVGLDGTGTYSGPPSYPNGCIICEVEVDPETGAVAIEKLSAVDDAGVVINPLTLEGQLHGSLAQGVGQILMEEVWYDPESGQLISGSFMDYCMPRADNMPSIEADVGLIPAKTNPLGVKGGSEAGNIAAPPAIANAIVDALASLGVTDIPLPATSSNLWYAISGGATNA